MAKAGRQRSTSKSSRNRKAAAATAKPSSRSLFWKKATKGGRSVSWKMAATPVHSFSIRREIYSTAQATPAHTFDATGHVQDIGIIFVNESTMMIDGERGFPAMLERDIRRRLGSERSARMRDVRAARNETRDAIIDAELSKNPSRYVKIVLHAVNEKLKDARYKTVGKRTVERRLRLLKQKSSATL